MSDGCKGTNHVPKDHASTSFDLKPLLLLQVAKQHNLSTQDDNVSSTTVINHTNTLRTFFVPFSSPTIKTECHENSTLNCACAVSLFFLRTTYKLRKSCSVNCDDYGWGEGHATEWCSHTWATCNRAGTQTHSTPIRRVNAVHTPASSHDNRFPFH